MYQPSKGCTIRKVMLHLKAKFERQFKKVNRLFFPLPLRVKAAKISITLE